MMPTLPEVHIRGTRAQQPAATSVSVGALYFVIDENKTERSNGAIWESFSDPTPAMLMADVQRRLDAQDVAIAELQRWLPKE